LKATCAHRGILIACLAWIAALLALVFSVIVEPNGATFPTSRPIQKQGVGEQRLLAAGTCGLVFLARVARLHTSNFEANILRGVNQVPLGCQCPDHYLLTHIYLGPGWIPHVSDLESNLLSTA
jgi:hypothetical protein